MCLKRKIYNKQEVTIVDVDFRQQEINSESQGKRIGILTTKQNDHDQQNQEPDIWKSNFWGAYRSALKKKTYNTQAVTHVDVDFRQHEINSESQGKRIGILTKKNKMIMISKTRNRKFGKVTFGVRIGLH